MVNYFSNDPLQSITLIWCFVWWAVLLFSGLLLGRPTMSNPQRIPRIARIGSSLMLVAASWSSFLLARPSPIGGYALLIAVGMTLGFVGDMFMAGLIRVIPPEKAIFGGIGAFGVGHIAYIAAFLILAGVEELTDKNRLIIAIVVWLLIGIDGWYVAVFRGRKDGKLTAQHLAALPYALLLASAAGLATGLALQDIHFVPLAIGTALFVISDLILAGNLFGGVSFPALHDVVWLTYGPAQALIVGTAAITLISAITPSVSR